MKNYEPTQKRLCFAPKSYDCGINDDLFLTIAFQHGEVLNMEDFEYKWANKGVEHFSDFNVRVIEVYKTTWEMCPYCDCEVELETKWEAQVCPECGMLIAPCSLCYPYDCKCGDCRLSKECDQANHERLRFDEFKSKVCNGARRAIDALTNDDNIIDIRASRSPYDPVKDTAIFGFAPLNHKEMWNFVKDAEEWSLDFYENHAEANYAEFMDIAVTSWK